MDELFIRYWVTAVSDAEKANIFSSICFLTNTWGEKEWEEMKQVRGRIERRKKVGKGERGSKGGDGRESRWVKE